LTGVPYADSNGIHRKHSAFVRIADRDGGLRCGRITNAQLEAAQHEALKDTIARLEQTGSPVLAGGEQTRPSFCDVSAGGATLARVSMA
jgi:hypothetical protein